MPSRNFSSKTKLSISNPQMRNKLISRLHKAIKSKKYGKKEMKVGKPMDLMITSENECAICLEGLIELLQ